MMDEQTRVVVVTGAAGGIGQAVVRAFVSSGWRVVGVDRSEPALTPSGARFMKADLSQPDEVRRVFRNVAAHEMRLDALVNNAAVQLCCALEDIDVEAWDHTMAVNVRAPVLAVQEALALFGRGAAVVNVASVHAFATSVHMTAYAASKGALTALTRALALELAPRGVRVNALAPGAVDTEMLRAGLVRGQVSAPTPEVLLERLASRVPSGRVGEPEEIADLIVLLADSDRSGYVTGQTLVVDGGALAMLGTEPAP